MKLSNEDFIVDMAIVHEDSKILTISENGFGKLTKELKPFCSLAGRSFSAGIN